MFHNFKITSYTLIILIAMVFALAPTATYAAAYIKFDGISSKMPGMRVTDKTTVREVAVFAARHADVEVDSISLSWRGRELWGQRGTEGQRTLGSYSMPGEATFQMNIVGGDMPGQCDLGRLCKVVYDID